MRLWRIQVCTVDKCLVFLLSLKYIMHRWFWQEDWWIFWSVGFYFAWEVSCVESSLTGYSVCWKGSSSLDRSSGLLSKESFLITVEGKRNNCEGLWRHKRLQSRRFASCSSSWRLWDGGRWKQWVAELRGSVCVCVFPYLCRLWTPPSIWADAVLLSNFRSPEYIMALWGRNTSADVQFYCLLLGSAEFVSLHIHRCVCLYRRCVRLFAPMSWQECWMPASR